MSRKLAYLCLQVTQEGQASYAHVHEIIKGLTKRGWQIDLFEPPKAEGNRGLLSRILEFFRAQIRLINGGSFDAIYMRSHYASLPLALWAKMRGIPVIQEVNGPFEDLFVAWPWTRRFSTLFKALLRSQLKWADAIITVTPELKRWLHLEIGEKAIYVVPNGANTTLFHSNTTTSISLQHPYVLFFGALAPWQGIDTLLAAVAEPDWPSDVTLVIIGDGIERAKVEAATRTTSRIQYLGKQPYQEMPGLISGSIAGLIPKSNLGGRSETGLSPLKLYETLACGVPAVVTDFPGQADLVTEHQCGLVIPPEDSKALAQAISLLHSRQEERMAMGQRGRVAIEASHSWDIRADDTSAILGMVADKIGS